MGKLTYPFFFFLSLNINRRFPDGLPILDPIQEMGIKDENFHKVVRVKNKNRNIKKKKKIILNIRNLYFISSKKKKKIEIGIIRR